MSKAAGKKRLRSITAFIVVTFVVSIILTVVLSSVISYRINMDDIQRSAYEKASIVNDFVTALYTSDTFFPGQELDDAAREPVERDILRTVCKSLGFRYLYMVNVDEENSEYMYIFLVASDDGLDASLKDAYEFGTFKKIPSIPQAVISASHGENDTTVWHQNNHNGNIYGWATPCWLGVSNENHRPPVLIAEFDADVIDREILTETLWLAAPIILIFVLTQILLLLIIRRRFLKPIEQISDSIGSFAEDPSAEAEKLSFRRNDEIGEIAASFNKMTDDVHRYLDDIGALTAEKVQIRTQLNIAERIQYGIVPEKTEMNTEQFNLCAIAKPCRQVGGDFYDCFMRDEDHLCIVMGDVSGKGISAALFMVMAKTSVKEKILSFLSPAEVLNRVNDELCSSNPEGLFATVFVGVLNIRTGQLRYANAGHTPPLIISGEAEYLGPEPGIALGLFEDAGIVNEKMLLTKSQGFILYTDGVTEAVNSHNEFYGEERLKKVLCGASSAKEASERIRESVYAFYRGREPFDDLTLLAVFFENDSDTLSLEPKLDEQDRINEMIRASAGNSSYLKKIILACEEVFTNIVSYSQADEITFMCAVRETNLLAEFKDNGVEFDSASLIVTKDFEDLDSGGMGLTLVRQIAHSLRYLRKGNENILQLTFRL